MSRIPQVSLDLPCQLLVEGNDDKNFFEALIGRLALQRRVEVQNYQGKNQFKSFFRAFIKHSKFGDIRSIGIVRDADASSEGAFKSIADSLNDLSKRVGVSLPIPTEQRQFVGEDRLIGVLILCDEQGQGMLESVILKTLANDSRWPCVERFVECLQASDPDLLTHPEKSYIHAFIAGTSSPHFSVGYAAKRGVFDLDHAAFDGIRKFLIQLARVGIQT